MLLKKKKEHNKDPWKKVIAFSNSHRKLFFSMLKPCGNAHVIPCCSTLFRLDNFFYFKQMHPIQVATSKQVHWTTMGVSGPAFRDQVQPSELINYTITLRNVICT